jgi:hypothetical protein
MGEIGRYKGSSEKKKKLKPEKDLKLFCSLLKFWTCFAINKKLMSNFDSSFFVIAIEDPK